MTFDMPHDEPPDKEEYEAWEKEHMSDDGIEPKEFPAEMEATEDHKQNEP